MHRKLLSRLLLVFLIASGGVAEAAYQFPANETKNGLPEEVAELQKISRGVSAIADKARGALVFISVAKTIKGVPFHMMDPFDFFFRGVPPPSPGRRQEMPKQQGLGSGFIVDLAKGYLITNNHVIEGADEINLKLANGKAYDGTVVGRDKNTDIAVVKIKDDKFDRSKLNAIGFANSDDVRMGDFVVALGAPFGLEASLSFGVVSAVGRGSMRITRLGNFIQTDAAINPGNSGGPLLNTEGRVIGVNTAIFSQSGAYNGIGFAVPSNLAKLVGQRLIDKGKIDRGFIGVSLQDLDKDLRESLKVPSGQEGAVVAHVHEGGPADKAGIKAEDVIVAVGGKNVDNADELATRVGLASPGETVELAFFRNGKRMSKKVKLGEYPDEEAVAMEGERPGKGGPLGLSVARLTKDYRSRFGIKSDSGVVVTNVAPDSEAARVGLRPGDLVLSVNNKRVKTPDEFKKAVGNGKKVLLRVEREGQYFLISLSR